MQELARRLQPVASDPRVRNGDEEPNRKGLTFGQSLPLQLSGSQLGLSVHERALDLDMEDLVSARQEHVSRTRVTGRDRSLQRNGPARVRNRGDGLRERELPRVAETDSGHRIEAPPDLVSTCGGQAATNLEGGLMVTPLDSTDCGLAKACNARELFLGETTCDASNSEFRSEARREIA